jgi:hypothetical protein
VVVDGTYNPEVRHALAEDITAQAVGDRDLNGVEYRKGVYLIDGFRPELTAKGQDADVYHHILFTAGNALHGTAGGHAENEAFLLYDQKQSYWDKRAESDTEVLDDYAGMAVGEKMLNTALANKGGDYWGLKSQIKNILCDH